MSSTEAVSPAAPYYATVFWRGHGDKVNALCNKVDTFVLQSEMQAAGYAPAGAVVGLQKEEGKKKSGKGEEEEEGDEKEEGEGDVEGEEAVALDD